MDSIYIYTDYRAFLRDSFEARARNGFGEAKKLAEHMNVHQTFISQMLKGVKSLNPEQALSACEYLNLNDMETEYFLLLAQIERAGTNSYKARLKRKIEDLNSRASELSNRLKHDAKLSPEQQATFYSDWIYSACRLSTLLPQTDTLESLSKHLGLPVSQLKGVSDFLVKTGMLKLENGRFKIGPLSTHLPSNSPWIRSHHLNWRQKAIEKMSTKSSDSLHYTAPMTVSRQDMKKIREILIKAINKTDKIVEPSPSETLVCLNIDFFEVIGSKT